MTTGTINLLHHGFSRRAWSKQAIDHYKNNGRVRHELMILNMGPVFSVQVHSYQGCEVKDRNRPEYNHDEVGGLDHFEIYVFRNSELIGGKPWEVISGKDLFLKDTEKDSIFIGYNETARDECLEEFLFKEIHKSNLSDHKLTIDLMTSAYLSISKERSGEIPHVHCAFDGENAQRFFNVYKTTEKFYGVNESYNYKTKFHCGIHHRQKSDRKTSNSSTQTI